MRRAVFASFVLLNLLGPRCVSSELQNDAAPAPAEQQRMVEIMTRYADQYVGQLPNFICRQVTTQYAAGKNGNKWRKGDTLTAKLVFAEGREERTLQLVNDKPPRAQRPRFRTSFSSEGEFGILLSKIFDPNSDARFNWVQWESIRDHKTARIDYAIDLQHSSMELTNYIKAKVPYHGSLYVDPEAGSVWRVTSGTSEIPSELQMKSIATTVDYSPVEIGTQKYLLPVSATVLLVTDRDQVKNDIQFDGYRKFEAESTITFGADSDGAKPPKTPQ